MTALTWLPPSAPLSAPTLARVALALRDVGVAWSGGGRGTSCLTRTDTFWAAMHADLRGAIADGDADVADPDLVATVTASVLASVGGHLRPTTDEVLEELCALLERTWESLRRPAPPTRSMLVGRVRDAARARDGGRRVASDLRAELRRAEPSVTATAAEVRVHAALRVARVMAAEDRRVAEACVAAALGVPPSRVDAVTEPARAAAGPASAGATSWRGRAAPSSPAPAAAGPPSRRPPR